jgi:hypothetical protein
MKRTFTTTLVGAAAVLALAATACKKEDGKKEAASGEAAPAGGGEGQAQQAVPSKTGFAVFPAASKVVAGLNLNSARSSALWAMYKPQIEAAMSQEVAEFKQACGFDPFTQLQSLVLGGDPNTNEMVVVAKGLEREQLKTCGEKLAAKEGKKFVVADEGNMAQYQFDNDKVWGVWLDKTTLVLAPEKEKDYVAQRAAGTGGLAPNAEIMGLLKNVDTAATFYLVATADAWSGNPATDMMKGAKGLFASIRLGEGLDLDAGMRFDTPANAKTFTDTVNQQLQMAKGQQMPPQLAGVTKAIEKAQIKQNGNDMIVTLKLTAEELKQLGQGLQQIGQAFMGSGMGAGMGGAGGMGGDTGGAGGAGAGDTGGAGGTGAGDMGAGAADPGGAEGAGKPQ